MFLSLKPGANLDGNGLEVEGVGLDGVGEAATGGALLGGAAAGRLRRRRREGHCVLVVHSRRLPPRLKEYHGKKKTRSENASV